MPRKSPVFYIAPSAISLLPNCNESPNDIEVTLARGAKIVVYSKDTVDMSGGFYQQWTIKGRNRRLADSSKPYTVYARLPKNDKAKGYLVFAPKVQRGGNWVDKYNYLLSKGLTDLEGATTASGYWYVKMGNVSLPENGERTITLDTGILGTDYYNATWALSPEELSRLLITCTIDGREAGPTPYVHWDKQLVLKAEMIEGWQDEEVERVDHWEITRDSGYPEADLAWQQKQSVVAFAQTGVITLSHLRSDDDFNGAVSSTFKVKAWGKREDGSDKELANGSVSILAETVEKYDLSLSTSIVSYDPQTKTYNPEGGVAVKIRATDQRGDTFRLTRQQYQLFGVALAYAQMDSDVWMPMALEDGEPTDEAVSILPVSVFAQQKGVEIRLTSSEGKELALSTVAFVRDGEDSKEREWIFLRSRTAITFGDLASEHPLPNLIPGGEVSPSGTATGEDTNKQQDDWVPEGWTDNSMGTDEIFVYEYGAYRDYVHESETVQEAHWGDFNTPRIWSHYGKDAITYDIIPSVSVIKANLQGVITLDGITVRAYRTDGDERSENILPEGMPPSSGNYYFAEYSIDGGSWQPCEGFSLGYGIDGTTVATATESVVFRLKHTGDPDTVLKESLPINVIKTLDEEDTDGLYLSKQHDDQAHGVIGFLKGVWFGIRDWFIDENGNANLHNLTLKGTFDAIKGYIDDLRSHNYQSGLLDGSGFRLTNNNGEDGSELEVDFLKVRKKATFMELEVREETFVGGNNHYSPAGSKIYRVEYMTENDESVGYTVMKVPFLLNRFAFLARMFNYAARKRIRRQLSDEEWRTVHHFRCYLLADDGTTATRNWWKVGDQPRCQTFNKAVSAQNKRDNTYNWKKDHYSTDPSTPMPDYTSQDGPYETAYYWRLCTNVGSEKLDDGHAYDFIDMPYEGWTGYTEQDKRSFRDSGSGIPVAGDTIVCIGNRYDEERMNCISLYTSGNDNNPPSIKGRRGIHTFSFENTLVWELSPEQFLVRSKNFKLLDDNGYQFAIPLERGEWVKGTRYHWYDRVSWAGCLWLCQVLDVYVWEDAYGTEYQPAQVDDIEIGEGSFTYSETVGGDTYTGTDHYYKKGKVNGRTVYYIRYFTYSEPDENNDLWLREVNRGRAGIDGDGVEFVFIRTAANEAPYISNSSDTYQEKTYLDDDYLPLSSAGRCTDDPVGPTKALPFEWMAKRCMTDPNSEGKRTWNKYNEGQIGGVMSLWATYSESAVRLDISNEMDVVLTSEGGKIDAARTVETVVHLYDGTSEVDISAGELAVSGAPASTIASVSQASEGTGKNGRRLSLAFIKDAVMADVYEITVSYTYKNVAYSAVFTVTASKGQAVWQLAPGMSSIPFQRDANNALTPASRDVSLMLVKVDKGSTETYATLQTGLTVRYAFDAMPASASAGTNWTSGSITVANSAENLYIALFNAAGTLLDRETVPVIKDGVNGQNVVRLDLDNENDTMLYNGSGTLVSGNVTTTGTLFDGMTDVSSQATFSIDSQTGCTASISGRTVTVSAMSATAGNVVVKAVYKEKTYKATLTLKKIVDGDKYELVVTPNSIAYNATTDTPSGSTLTIQVWKTSVNGSGGSTRSLSAPPSGYAVYANGSTVSASSTGIYYYSTDNSEISEVLVKIATGASSSDILDSETVPIAKASNGAKGDTGPQGGQGPQGPQGGQGPQGDYEVIEYARSSSYTSYSNTYIDGGAYGWSSTAPLPSYTYPAIWKRSIMYDPSTGSTYGSYSYVCLSGKDGKDGRDGQDGDPGKTGLWYRYAGVWNVDVTSVTNTNTVGYYVKEQYSNNFWMNTLSSGVANTNTPGGTGWESMLSVFPYFITKATFADTAYLGSFIINGDWMISQYGGPSGKTYEDFDAFHFGFYIQGLYPSYSGFIPNFAVDGKTGTTYQNNAYVRGKITAESGMIGKFSIETDGSMAADSASLILRGKGTNNRDAALMVQGQAKIDGLAISTGFSWSAGEPVSFVFARDSFTLPSVSSGAIFKGSIIFVKSLTTDGIRVSVPNSDNAKIMRGDWAIDTYSEIGRSSAFYILADDKFKQQSTGWTGWLWVEFFCG